MQNDFGIDVEGSPYYQKVIDKPIPCLLLRKDLPIDTLVQFVSNLKVVDIKYEGETYFALPIAFLIPPRRDEKVVGKVFDASGNITEAKKEE